MIISPEMEAEALYVHEGSWAVVSRNSAALRWIGSDDATTCHLIAMVGASHVAVSHVDRSRPEDVEAHLHDMSAALGEDGKIEVYVCGGMAGDDIPAGAGADESVQISLAVLQALVDSPRRFALRLAAVSHLNRSDDLGCPAARGLVVELSTGHVARGQYAELARGCELDLRLAAASLYQTGRGMPCGYDEEEDVYRVPAPQLVCCCEGSLKSVEERLEMSDEEIMAHIGTSPGYEQPRFARDIRAKSERAMRESRACRAAAGDVGAVAVAHRHERRGDELLVPRLLS
jgi:hypothetical protein